MSGKRSGMYVLEVVGSNFGGGRKGALFGLYEVEEGYIRDACFV